MGSYACSADDHHGHLRDELRAHAGAYLAVRLSVGAGSDAIDQRRTLRGLQTGGMVVAQTIRKDSYSSGPVRTLAVSCPTGPVVTSALVSAAATRSCSPRHSTEKRSVCHSS